MASLACAVFELTIMVISNQSQTLSDVLLVFATPLALLLWVAVCAWSIVFAVYLIRRRMRRFALLCPIVPIAMFAATYWAIPYVQFPQDYMHFRALKASYDASVNALPNNGYRYAEFNWGGLTFSSKGVVYDETDQVALPYGHQSDAWKSRMRYTDLTCGGEGPVGEVVPLGSHYYVVAFGC